jgi:hypothetical protein
MQIRPLTYIALLACFALTACSTVIDGVVVKKRFRVGEPAVDELYDISFRFEPSVYWVQVEGKDRKGRERTRNIILFRHDWQQLRVGDHWTANGGFTPAPVPADK